MRQVLVEQNAALSGLSGDRFVLKASDLRMESVPTSVLVVQHKMPIKVISGGHLSVDFQLSKTLALKGAVLLGAYLEGDNITVALMSLQGAVTLGPDDEVVVGVLVETVRYRQIPPEISNAKVKMDAALKSRRRK